MGPTRNAATVALAVFALAGVIFSAVSTYDYAAFLDRQVHAITCSLVPGIGAPDTTGSSGCHAVLMSPYSAVFRTWTWGGIPIALPALAVFVFLFFRAFDLLLRRLAGDADEARFTVAATLLPVVVSVIYFLISILRVGAVCKLCVGTYAASIGAFVAAIVAYRQAVRGARPRPIPWGRYAGYFLEGVAFVFVPALLYVVLKPAYAGTVAGCGELLHPEDRYGVRVKLTSPPGGVPAIEVLDPLCPACKGFSQRLAASGLGGSLSRELVLFPLDKECNWMVSESLHPGACAVSEAVLCGGARADEVLEWAFGHQAELRELGKDSERVYARIAQQFPQLAGCLGKPAVRSRLNRSLRWAVANSLPVVTPQLFVRGQKICDEDTDLGLEYVLSRTLAGQQPGEPRRAAR
ncbi:MAG TPA: vitamin K epoxide reductase family protein [Thermoanaerobaculaceae bacterium]|nr:vitamin K epoxide reductase family protein [Thermoanaerobaculaceae bacterium]